MPSKDQKIYMIRTIILFFTTLVLFSCNSLVNEGKNKTLEKKDYEIINPNKNLNRILKNKKLIAVTDYGPTSYFIYRGQPMGYQYELLKKFTDYLNIELELQLKADLIESMELLDSSAIDLIAMGLTVTNERKEFFDFTEPIITTRMVLIQRKPDGFEKMKTLDEIESHLIRNTLDLAGKKIYVEKGTVYKERLVSLANSMGNNIEIIEDDKWTDRLILDVANGEIDYTIADEHLALVSARQFRNLDVKTAVSFPQNISWATQKGQQRLIDTLNYWLKGFKKKLEFRLLYNKYFINRRSYTIAKSTYNSYSGNKLSPYDDIIKKYAPIIGWDWRLIASLMYQESEFKPNVKSWVGAYGLMQLMPIVMEKYGIDSTANAEQQIEAGIKHLKYKESQIPKSVTDTMERIKFTLASYNSGVGHILDARRLTEKYKKNPNVWDNNVANYVLKLSDKNYYHDPVVYYGYMRGDETFNLVSEVLYRYYQYKDLIRD